jgi:hypothetical protein
MPIAGRQLHHGATNVNESCSRRQLVVTDTIERHVCGVTAMGMPQLAEVPSAPTANIAAVEQCTSVFATRHDLYCGTTDRDRTDGRGVFVVADRLGVAVA